MRFESQTHPQDDHVDRITDCSTRYGQAPAVCTGVRLAKGRWPTVAYRHDGVHGCRPTVVYKVQGDGIIINN